MSIHLRPTAPIAADALLPGDPGRALALAQDLLVKPMMSNHHRGLWGYHGETAEGRELTIQSTGIGGPSAAIVLTELAELGVRRAIRVGTCAATGDDLGLGQIVIVTEAIAADGASRALGAGARAAPDASLSNALAAQVPTAAAVVVATTDLFYGREGTALDHLKLDGAAAVEMETATLFTLGAEIGVGAACLLTVVAAGGERITEERLADAELEMGRAAGRALAEAC
ncbi:MAG: purine-nucleoside phosphorylase [Solirubrobacterales bacterium]